MSTVQAELRAQQLRSANRTEPYHSNSPTPPTDENCEFQCNQIWPARNPNQLGFLAGPNRTAIALSGRFISRPDSGSVLHGFQLTAGRSRKALGFAGVYAANFPRTKQSPLCTKSNIQFGNTSPGSSQQGDRALRAPVKK